MKINDSVFMNIRPLNADKDIQAHVNVLVRAMTEIVLFSEDWTMSDYRRCGQKLVVYLRHHSNFEITKYGEFISPFFVEDCELGYGEDVSPNPDLDRFLRQDARLWYATELLRRSPSIPAWYRNSSYDDKEWVLTKDTPLLSVLADRGFYL